MLGIDCRNARGIRRVIRLWPEEYPQRQYPDAEHDRHVRNVEDRELDEAELEEVGHAAENHAVDQVARSTRCHEAERHDHSPFAWPRTTPVRCDHEEDGDGSRDEHRLSSRKEAESGADISHERDVEHVSHDGNRLPGNQVGANQRLGCLIENQRDERDRCEQPARPPNL